MNYRELRTAALLAAATIGFSGSARAATVIYSFAGEVDAFFETETWEQATGVIRSSGPAGAPFQIQASFTVQTTKLPQNVAQAPSYAQYLSGPLPRASAWLTSAVDGASTDGTTWPLSMNGEGDVVLDGRDPEGPASFGSYLVTFGEQAFVFGTTIFNGETVTTQYTQYFRSGLQDGAGSIVAGGFRLPNFSSGLNAPFATFESVSVMELTYLNSADQVVFSERRVSGLRKAVPITVTILADAVPEPAAWVAMIFGFGLMGTAMRRSRHLPHAG